MAGRTSSPSLGVLFLSQGGRVLAQHATGRAISSIAAGLVFSFSERCSLSSLGRRPAAIAFADLTVALARAGSIRVLVVIHHHGVELQLPGALSTVAEALAAAVADLVETTRAEPTLPRIPERFDEVLALAKQHLLKKAVLRCGTGLGVAAVAASAREIWALAGVHQDGTSDEATLRVFSADSAPPSACEKVEAVSDAGRSLAEAGGAVLALAGRLGGSGGAWDPTAVAVRVSAKDASGLCSVDVASVSLAPGPASGQAAGLPAEGGPASAADVPPSVVTSATHGAGGHAVSAALAGAASLLNRCSPGWRAALRPGLEVGGCTGSPLRELAEEEEEGATSAVSDMGWADVRAVWRDPETDAAWSSDDDGSDDVARPSGARPAPGFSSGASGPALRGDDVDVTEAEVLGSDGV